MTIILTVLYLIEIIRTTPLYSSVDSTGLRKVNNSKNNNICNDVCTSNNVQYINNNKVNDKAYANQEIGNKMDIDIDIDNNNGVKKEEVGIKNINTENKCLSSMYNNKNENVNSNEINQNIISNNNNNSNYSFSKISNIQEDMPKSAEQQKINLIVLKLLVSINLIYVSSNNFN